MLILIVLLSLAGIAKALDNEKSEYKFSVAAEVNDFQDMPYLEAINFTGYNVYENSLFELMQRGDFDLGMAGAADIIPASMDPNIQIRRSPGRSVVPVMFNLQVAPYDLLAFRQAVAHICDKVFLSGLHNGEAQPLHSVVPPDYNEYFNPNVPVYDFSFDLASSVLDAANILDTDLDGWREDPRTGSNIHFELMAGGIPHFQVAEEICSNLHSININASVVPFIFSDILQRNFDVCILTWMFEPVPIYLNYMFHSSFAHDLGSYNFVGYDNPVFDQVIGAALQEVDFSSRVTLFHQAQEILAEDLPWIPLFSRSATYLTTPNFEGYIPWGGLFHGILNYYSMLNVRPAEGYSSQTLRVGFSWVGHPNPFIAGGGAISGGLSNHLIFDTLTTESPTGKLEGRLAKKWDISPDMKSYTINIASNAIWHDGNPVTSADVKFSFDYYRNYDPIAYGLLSNITDIQILNNTALSFEFNSPRPFGLYELAFYPIIPQHIWETITDPYAFTDPLQIGSGPFQVASFSVNEAQQGELILNRNPNYFNQPLLGASGSGTTFEIDATETAQAILNVESTNPIEVDVTVTSPPDVAFFDSLVGALEISANLSSGFSIDIRMYYTDAEVAGMDESQLQLYHWNEESLQWEVVPNSGVNTLENYVYGTIDHLSILGALIPKSPSMLLQRLHLFIENLEASDFRGTDPEQIREKLLTKVERIQELLEAERYFWVWFQLNFILPFQIRHWILNADTETTLLYLVRVTADSIY